MYGMGFDGDDDALDVLAAAAGAPAPAAAEAAAGGAPVHAHHEPDPNPYAWMAGGLPPRAPPAGVGAGGLPPGHPAHDAHGQQAAAAAAPQHAPDGRGDARRVGAPGRRMYSPEEYAAAARAIQPGCERWNVKESWPTGVCKPTIPAMKDEMKRRGGTVRTHMSAEDLCSWLHNNAMPAGGGGGAGPAPEGEGGTQRPTQQPPPASCSWVNNLHYPRLIECIRAHPGEFSQRDAKPSNRVQLDGVDRNSAWRTIIAKFNDDSFQPVSASTHSQDWDDVLQDLDPSSRCGLTLSAKDGEKKFKELSSKLRKAYNNFKKSGQGDNDQEAVCADDDDDDDEDADAQDDSDGSAGGDTGSDFWDFCHGDTILLYAYKWLLLDGLLDSAIGDMPEGTRSNSNEPGETVRPRKDSTGSRRSDTSDALYAISGAMQAPVSIAQSALQKRVMHFASQAAKRKAQVLQAQLSAEKEKQLDEVTEQIDRLKSSGKPVPSRLLSKRDRLTRELDEEEQQMAAGGGADDDPEFEDDPPPPAPAAPSSKAAGKRVRKGTAGGGLGGGLGGGRGAGPQGSDSD